MEVTELFSKGVDVFKKNPVIAGPLIVVGIVMGAVTLALLGGAMVGGGMMGLGMMKPSMGTIGAFVGGVLVVGIIGGILNLLAMGMTYVMSNDAIDGKADLGGGIQKTTGNIVNLLVASILVGVIVFIGMILLVVPGLLALYLLMFAIPMVMLDNRSPADALKGSFDLVKSHVGETIIFAVVAIVVYAVAGIIAGIFRFIPVLGSVIISPIISGAAGAYISVVLILLYRELKK